MPAGPLLPVVRLRIDHLTALDAKLRQSEVKIGHAARSAASLKNLSPTVHSSEQLSTVAVTTERNCVAVLGALSDGRTQVRRAIEKLETAERIFRGPPSPIQPIVPYSEAIDILRGLINPILIIKWGKTSLNIVNTTQDFLRKIDGSEERLRKTITRWTKQRPGLDFLDDWSRKIGLSKINGVAARSLPVLKRLPWIGVAFDSKDVVKNIRKGNWGGVAWHGVKIVAGVAVAVSAIGALAVGGVPVAVIAGVALAAMTIAELVGTERFKKAGNWLLDKGKDTARWAGEKASSGVSWVKNQGKRAADGVVTGVRDALENGAWGVPIYRTSPVEKKGLALPNYLESSDVNYLNQHNMALLDAAIASENDSKRLKSLVRLRRYVVDHENFHPPLYLLKFDPNDDGKIVLSKGNPYTAKYTQFSVPGMKTKLTGVEEDVVNTLLLHSAIRDQGMEAADEYATVFFLDWDPPDWDPSVVGLATPEIASEAFEDAFIPFIRLIEKENPSSRITVAAHSFGTYAVSWAISRNKLPIDGLALMGSPGVPVEHVSDLTKNMNNGATVYSYTTKRDAVAIAVPYERLLDGPVTGLLTGLLLGPAVGPVVSRAVSELTKSGDPKSSDFEATRGSTSNEKKDESHGGYFAISSDYSDNQTLVELGKLGAGLPMTSESK